MKITNAFLLLLVLTTAMFAQQKITPIYEANVGGLIGGVQNGKWLKPEQVAPSLKGGEDYIIAGWKGVEEGGITNGGKPQAEEPCMDFYNIEMDLEFKTGIAIGDSIRWNVVPRVPVALNLKDPVYVKIVSDFLKAKKIVNPKVQIKQLYRVDLEGDGKDEVLISATRYLSKDTTDATKGDYSFTMLRKVVGKTVKNILLDGEFYTSFKDFSAPNTYEFSGVADLNGDGKMEIIVYAHYYEGGAAWVYEMKGNVPMDVKPLGAACGV